MKPKAAKKVKTLTSLAKVVKKLKKTGKKIVLCHGVFDLIHPGHIRHLRAAREYGDVLIVTITADKFVKKGPGRPIFSQTLRCEVLSTIDCIDYVTVVNSDTAIPAIAKIKPDFYVKGPDYKERKLQDKIPRKLGAEEEAVKNVGGKLVFTEDIIFSSSRLINEHLDVYPAATKRYLDHLKIKYPADYVIEKLTSLRDLKILIIGDAIVDEYHYCLPSGKSSKEPVMVHQYIKKEAFIGGTLATANHLCALSDNITLTTLLGKRRSLERFISRRLRPQVKAKLFYQGSINTIVKRRYVDFYTRQKLFQLSFLKETLLAQRVERQILKFLDQEIKKHDLVIVNDFGHGLLTDKIIKTICKQAPYLALNVQANSANYGFNVVTKYPRADYVCIDKQEIRLATHDQYGDLTPLIKKIYKTMQCSNMSVTKGPEGSVSYNHKIGFWTTPALTEKIVDRVGAGDALFAVTSPCVYAGLEHDLVSFVGNLAGALQVQVVGNSKQVEFGELVRFITRLLK